MRPQQKSAPRMAAGNALERTLHGNSTTSPADLLLARLDRVKQTAADSWLACCPSHDDRSPSLSIKQVDDRILVHCFSGCEAGSILAAVGLTLADLFDKPLAHHKAPLSSFQRKRHGQAADALRALRHESLIVHIAAGMVRQGEALDDAALDRLATAERRIKRALEVVA